MEELTERLDNFIFKIRNRFLEVIDQSREPLEEVIGTLQYDTIVIHNILTGLKYQLVEQLTEKAEEGWEKFLDSPGSDSVFDSPANEQRKKIDILIGWMNREFSAFRINTYSKAAHKILDNVKKHVNDNKKHSCTQCGGVMNINIYSFMAKNIKCEYCGSVNTYEPDDRIRALEYYVITHLASESAFPAWLKVNTEVSFSAIYSDELKKNFDLSYTATDEKRLTAAKEYYRIYYGFLMKHIPDKKEFYERQMNERIDWLKKNGITGTFMPE